MNVTMKRTGVTLGMAVLLLSGCGTKNPKPDLDLRPLAPLHLDAAQTAIFLNLIISPSF